MLLKLAEKTCGKTQIIFFQTAPHKVLYFKIEPRRNVTMHVQSHELHHGCSM